jgi:hypothetical protein
MTEVPLLCMVTFTSTIRNWGTKACRSLRKPKLTNSLWGAGLSFHRAHAELSVPVDPYLDNVFDGEEGSRAVRFWTHGYDVFAPDRILVTHDYKGHQSNAVVHTWGGKLRGGGGGGGKRGGGGEDLPLARIGEISGRLPVKGTERVNLLLGVPASGGGGRLVGSKEQEVLLRKSK